MSDVGLYDRPVLVLDPGHAHGADQAMPTSTAPAASR